MAQKIINARAKNKRDTSSNWTANDPVLLDGEIIIVDTADGEVREKIGDGIKTYTQLPFSDEKLRNLLNNHEGDSDIHVTAEQKAKWDEHASTHATDGSDPITPASIGAAPISTTTEATLAAASWSGDSAPYTYTLTVNGVTDTSTQEIVFATSINLEQLTAGQNANIQDGGQSANTIVLKAWGEKPTVDLPIRVIMRG